MLGCSCLPIAHVLEIWSQWWSKLIRSRGILISVEINTGLPKHVRSLRNGLLWKSEHDSQISCVLYFHMVTSCHVLSHYDGIFHMVTQLGNLHQRPNQWRCPALRFQPPNAWAKQTLFFIKLILRFVFHSNRRKIYYGHLVIKITFSGSGKSSVPVPM